MARPFLFGGNAGNQSQNKYLVEFRAGKMTMKGNMVHPDKRKGLVFLQQTDDALMHFRWKDRKTGAIEDDLIIFPDDAEFKRVPQCTTGRVYVLKFKSSSRKCFYWMQEPKVDKDDEFCTKVNENLNNPPLPGSNRSGVSGNIGGSSTPSQGGGLQSELSGLADGDLQNLLNNVSQQQLMQLLGVSGVGGISNLSSILGSRPSSSQSSTTELSHTPTESVQAPAVTSTTTASSTPSSISVTQSTAASQPVVTTTAASPTTTSVNVTATTPSAQQFTTIQLRDLQDILSGLNTSASPSDSSSSNLSVDLSTAITAEVLQPLFENEDLMNRVRSLLPPSSEPVDTGVSEQLKATVKSPQFQQALSMFSAALQSGQLGPLMQQFGMSQDVVNAANSGDMEAFVRALQASQKKEESDDKSSGSSKDKDKDEDMSLD